MQERQEIKKKENVDVEEVSLRMLVENRVLIAISLQREHAKGDQLQGLKRSKSKDKKQNEGGKRHRSENGSYICSHLSTFLSFKTDFS